MLRVTVIIAIFGLVFSAPLDQPQVPLLQENFTRDDHGQYSYNFLTGDGVARTEQGSLVPNADGTANVLVQRGGYRYLLPSGELVEVNYVADENGFRVSGSHLPTPPSVPVV
jgi:Insect cuticle protein